jgi:hypothetical protein
MRSNSSTPNIFTVTVNEVNSAPVLQPIADQTVHFGNLLSLQAVATDETFPPTHSPSAST